MTIDSAVCTRGHTNPPSAKYCGTCGEKIPEVKREESIWVEARHLLVGLGQAGGNILLQCKDSNKGQGQPSTDYLLLDTSPREVEHLLKIFPAKAVRMLGKSIGTTGRVWKRGEAAAAEALPKILFEHAIERYQAVLTVTSLGGGTGAGACPLLLNMASQASSKIEKVTFALLPSDEEPDLLHFNAYCGLSRLISFRARRNVDLAVLVGNSQAEIFRGIGRDGREMRRDETLAAILNFVTSASEEGNRFPDLTQMSKSTGLVHCVPCLALNHSLRIFGSLSNILESATSRPLLDTRKETALYSLLFLRLPSTFRSKMRIESLLKEFNLWKEESLPREIGGDCCISYSDELSDRIDALLLLGGSDIAGALARTSEGYSRVKRDLYSERGPRTARTTLEQTEIPIQELEEIEKVIKDYTVLVRSWQEPTIIEEKKTVQDLRE